MPWNGKILVDIDGKEMWVYVTTGASFFDSGVGLRLALSKDDISELTDDQLVKLLRSYQRDADEIELVGFAGEINWNQQYLTSSDLLVIKNSKFASEDEKRNATALLDGDLSLFQPRHKTRKRKKQRGFIYVFADANNTYHFKIGMSVDPKRRLTEIENAALFHCFPTDDMTKSEKYLHETYHNQRTNGEWFILYEPNLEYLQSIVKYENEEFYFCQGDK